MIPHVLFVDDDEPNLAVFAALCGDDFPILTASSASAALVLMRQHEVGVVLSDQRMPDVTGVEFLEQVRAEFPDTVRMLATAYADLSATIDAINKGHVRRYIRKPWDAEELKAHLAEGISRYRTQREAHAVERRLLETERVYGLGVIAASLAAELREPAAAVAREISVARDLLRVGLDSTPPGSGAEARSLRARMAEADEALVDAVGAVDAMMGLVRGIEVPTHARDENVVDLRNLVRLTLRILRSELREVGEVKIDLTSVPDVRGSSSKLGQVVVNLLVNAVRAVADKPRPERFVSVRLTSEDSSVNLEVEDNRDEPVSSELVSFDPFAKRERFVGTAFGLAISKRIAEEVGGRIDAETRASKRTLFRLSVPVLMQS
ncbi:MAG TPA: response regulator [Polyangiaceae bacterium]|jgi:C4-dicarboxylate-specific signal transduction histidine kinase|nr:response regulator [Polyangiaceae bacterium]